MEPFASSAFDPDRAADDAALPAALRGRPRRTSLRPPETTYFDALPARVLTRLRTEKRASAPPTPFLRLPAWPRLKLTLASATLSGAFVLALWIGRPALLPVAAPAEAALLAGISPDEVVAYLTAPDAPCLAISELSNLVSLADADLAPALTAVSDADVQQALSEEPLDDTYL